MPTRSPPPTPPKGARKVTQQGSTFYVIGDERRPLRDAYHTFLKAPWWLSFVMIAVGWMLCNVGFAILYVVVGGVDGARAGSFFDALAFSVQTLGTIGYGVMHPESGGANAVMIVESVVGIIVTALATGLVFAKFSRPTTRVAFSERAVITQFEGRRTLMFRVGNRRSNTILEAQLHVVAIVTRKTEEGELFYKSYDLTLVRDRQVGMTRGWTVMHVIDALSPLREMRDAAAFAKAELELHVSLTGTDDISMQQVYTTHHYSDGHIQIGHRFEDTLSAMDDGTYIVDLRNFDRTVPDHVARG